MATITNNSEILFIYDAKMTNPNGDMDNENKPRMDYDTSTNLVSDVRLKRYLRDYFEKQLGEPIFITESAKDAKYRNKQLKDEGKTHKDLIDCRMFGAVFAETGGSDHLTGPIQFNWGYSLNKVELIESTTITSSFSSGEGVGKDYRVKYSLIAFNGAVNANTAKHTGLSDDDIAVFDRAMINAIPFCRTRSKIGQTPRLYLRVELADNKTFLKDLREPLPPVADDDFKLRGIDDFKVDIKGLVEYLKKFETKIKMLHYWKDEALQLKGWDALENAFSDKLNLINPTQEQKDKS
ncbi:MAG: type I-B CRISPR-associated protein Cas7/Csh2 [Proteobacteria bacterium]|nr:type I-B CRISPR-associated protein Cas7/Csh2 [Pseudomonadota bacterium]